MNKSATTPRHVRGALTRQWPDRKRMPRITTSLQVERSCALWRHLDSMPLPQCADAVIALAAEAPAKHVESIFATETKTRRDLLHDWKPAPGYNTFSSGGKQIHT